MKSLTQKTKNMVQQSSIPEGLEYTPLSMIAQAMGQILFSVLFLHKIQHFTFVRRVNRRRFLINYVQKKILNTTYPHKILQLN